MDVIGKVAFGVDFGTTQNGSAFFDDLEHLMDGWSKRCAVPKVMWNWSFPDQKQFLELCDRVKSIPRNIIEERKRAAKNEVHEGSKAYCCRTVNTMQRPSVIYCRDCWKRKMMKEIN